MAEHKSLASFQRAQKARFERIQNEIMASTHHVAEELKMEAERLTAGPTHSKDSPAPSALPIGQVTGKLHDSWTTSIVNMGNHKHVILLKNDAPEAKFAVKNPKRGFMRAITDFFKSRRTEWIKKTVSRTFKHTKR